MLIPIVHAADFGEDEEYLDQIVDDYEDTDFVNVTVEIIHNASLECMELNYTSGGGFENLSAYTEVDSAGDLTVTDNNLTWDTMRRDAESWVVYDFGAGYFTDFQVNYTLDFSDIEAGDDSSRDINALSMFSNSIGTFADVIAGDLLCILPRQVGLTDDRHIIVLRQMKGGGDEVYEVGAGNYFMTPLYITLERSGTTVTMRTYSDYERTALLETLTDTGVNDAYRYFHILASYDSATGDPADHSTGIITNVTFGMYAMYSTSGYYTTIDMLDGDRGLALMYNGTIPAGTVMTIQFWNGSAWVDHNNEAGSDTLTEGYETLDTRDIYPTACPVRVNQTSDGGDTPRMNQLRWITVTTVDVGGGLFPGLAIGISLLIIAAIYFLEKRR